MGVVVVQSSPLHDYLSRSLDEPVAAVKTDPTPVSPTTTPPATHSNANGVHVLSALLLPCLFSHPHTLATRAEVEKELRCRRPHTRSHATHCVQHAVFLLHVTCLAALSLYASPVALVICALEACSVYHAWHRWQHSKHWRALHSELTRLRHAHQELDRAIRRSVRVITDAELAARGYRVTSQSRRGPSTALDRMDHAASPQQRRMGWLRSAVARALVKTHHGVPSLEQVSGVCLSNDTPLSHVRRAHSHAVSLRATVLRAVVCDGGGVQQAVSAVTEWRVRCTDATCELHSFHCVRPSPAAPSSSSHQPPRTPHLVRLHDTLQQLLAYTSLLRTFTPSECDPQVLLRMKEESCVVVAQLEALLSVQSPSLPSRLQPQPHTSTPCTVYQETTDELANDDNDVDPHFLQSLQRSLERGSPHQEQVLRATGEKNADDEWQPSRPSPSAVSSTSSAQSSFTVQLGVVSELKSVLRQRRVATSVAAEPSSIR